MEEFYTGVGGLHKTQDDYINGGADIFGDTQVDKACISGFEAAYYPTNEAPEGPFIFYIPGESDTYVDPQTFRLSGYTSIKKVSPTTGQLVDIDEGEDVAPINFLPGMAFQSKQFDINGVAVNYITQPLENYKAYFETLLSYGGESKDTILRKCVNWMPDAHGEMEDMKSKHKTYKISLDDQSKLTAKEITIPNAWEARKNLWAKSARVPFSMPLHMDVLTTDRFLPKDINITIKLTKTRDEVLYTAATVSGNYRILFHNLKLMVNRIKMLPSLIQDHEKRFAAGELARFPYTRTDSKFVTIAKGESSFRTHNIFRKWLPNSAIVFFVDSAALTGSRSKNALNFQNFNVEKLYCLKKAQEVPPNGYVQDYENNDFAETYRRVFDEIGIRTNTLGINLTAEDFKNGYNFYAFDFSPDKCNSFHAHQRDAGGIDFGVVFKKATTTQISMVILCQYDDEFKLDARRNVVGTVEPN